jgi:hypothetical protein
MSNFDEVTGDEIVDNDKDRGCIKYRDRYSQGISFEGLTRTGKITPTDIDGVIDYNGNAFLFIEGKLKGTLLHYGQRLAYENLKEVLERGGAYVWCIIFEHTIPPEQDIIAKEQIVSEILSTDVYGWRVPVNRNMTVIDAIEEFEKICLERGIKIFKYPKQ